MANYFIDNNGNWSNKNKKQSGNNYTINSSGQWVNNTVKKAEKNSNANPFVVAGKTVGNALTNLGTGAIKAVEGTADFISDVIANPIERGLNYVYDYASKGKKVADENYKDLKEMQKRDIKRDLTKEFQDYTGFSDIKEDWEKDSLIKSNNFGGQVAQGIGGMVPSLVVGSAAGITNPELASTKGLSGADKAKTILKNVGATYKSQLPANALLGTSSYGSGVEEALQKGATMEQARRYGLANAAIEQGTEMLTGGIPGLQGKGGIDQVIDPLIDKTGGYANALLKAGYGALGEGLEESAGTYLDALAKRNIFNEDIDWNQVNQEALQSGLVGAATGAILNTPSNIENFQNVKVANQQEKVANSGKSVATTQAEEQPTTQVNKSVQSEINQNVTQPTNVNQTANEIQTTTNETKNIAEARQEPVIQSKEYQEAKQKVANGTATEKERRFIKTATESQNTQKLIEDMDEVAKNYQVISNEKSMKQAEAKLNNKKSLEEKATYINDLLNSGKRLDSSDVAAAELVLKDAAASKNAKVYSQVLENISIYATEAGQNIQALSMIKRLSPSSQLDVLEKIINREKAKGNKAYQDVEVTEEMKNKIFDCYDENGNIDQEKFDNTMEEIKQELANEIKVSAGDKIRAWRYLSMLGNPKTHVRNEIANVAMSLVKLVKDTVNATGQDLFIKDKLNKTTTLKSSSKEVKNLANNMYEQVYTQQENSKYNEQSDLENRREVFKTKPIEKARKFNEKMLSSEDQFFKKINFKRSFANYLTAQGISTQTDIEAHPEIVQKAKNFAIEEANIATFNQRNKLSEFINSADNKLGTTGKVIRGAIIPFTRTPLNIAKTGIEYTPGTGLLKTVVDVRNASKNMKGTVLIDGLSKQITGSSLALLGYALAKSGLVTSNGDDDKEDYFKIDQGNKMNYSIKIGDTSYDLSWLSPSSMPFFVGARMFEVLDKQEGVNENLILESLASTLDPLSEMSVISSFTDVLSSFGNSSTGKIKDMAVSTGQNYLSQFIPTVAGQFARLFDDTKRTTTADKNATNKISQETLRQLAYKIPGLRNTLPASTDYFGQPKKEQENEILRAIDAFINPANTKKDNLSKESKEILDIYEKTGNGNIIPTSLQQYIVFNNNKYEMSRKEYNEYKKEFGDTFNKNIKELFNTYEYKNASNEQKAKMIEKIMNYSKDKAKDTFLTEKGVDYTTRTKTGKISYKESRKVENIAGKYGIVDYYINKVLKESD